MLDSNATSAIAPALGHLFADYLPTTVKPGLFVAVGLGLVFLVLRALQSAPEEATWWQRSRPRVLAIVGALFGATFLVLVHVTNKLPVTHGSKVIMKHELTRAAALGVGVLYLVMAIAALLPLLLDVLERSGFSRFVGARHIRASKSGFLTTISVLSICGVAFSSCALGSVISIMGGFGQDLKRKILANQAHVVVDTTNANGFEHSDLVLGRVRGVPGVIAATPMIQSEVMASVGSNMSGVILRGIDVDTIGDVIDLPNNVELPEHPAHGPLQWLKDPEELANLPWSEHRGPDDADDLFVPSKATFDDLPAKPAKNSHAEKHEPIDPDVEKVARTEADEPVKPIKSDKPIYPGVVVGRELARTLHLRIGSEMSLVSRMGELTPRGVIPRERRFRVAGIFFSGMYEYDVAHAYITLDAARDFLDQHDTINAIAIKVNDSEKVEPISAAIATAVGREDLRTRDWKIINNGLFSALALERVATFIVLSLAIVVASFCILCTLLLMVTEKGREIAILKALGASDAAILRVFMVEGMIIGGIGTTFGVSTGYAVCYGLSWFGVRIDPAVYYIDRLPIAVNAVDFLAVTVAALVICAISTLYPAWSASKLVPVEGLRYE